jgi:hypothetical protein
MRYAASDVPLEYLDMHDMYLLLSVYHAFVTQIDSNTSRFNSHTKIRYIRLSSQRTSFVWKCTDMFRHQDGPAAVKPRQASPVDQNQNSLRPGHAVQGPPTISVAPIRMGTRLNVLSAGSSSRAECVVGRHDHEAEHGLGQDVSDGIGAHLETLHRQNMFLCMLVCACVRLYVNDALILKVCAASAARYVGWGE